MKISIAKNILGRCVSKGHSVLLTGAPGIGKSELIESVRQDYGMDIILSHPAVAESTDAKGFPFPNKEGTAATFLPYGDLDRAIRATRPTVWFLDDFGQADVQVQASFMQLLLARQIGDHKISDHVTFAAATNRRQDKAGVNGLLEPVKSRFKTILELEPDLAGWLIWALRAGMPPEVMAFLRFRPDLLFCPSPTLDLVNSPSPRTWYNLGVLLRDEVAQTQDELIEVSTGTIGTAAATQFAAFYLEWKDMVAPESVLLSPKTAAIPKSISSLYSLCTALAVHATASNFGRIVTYAKRLKENGLEEYSSVLIKDSVGRNPDVTNSSAYSEAVTNEFSSLF